MSRGPSWTRPLDRYGERWERVEPSAVWSALAIVLAASCGLALNRFGGLAFDAPRSFVRLSLYGVWGWLGLSAAIWATATVIVRRAGDAGTRRSPLQLMLAIVGWGHAPLGVLAIVIFVAAGLLQLLGPGLVVGAIALGVLFPLALVTGVRNVFGVTHGRAALAVVVPYGLWLAVVARPVHDQIQHLL